MNIYRTGLMGLLLAATAAVNVNAQEATDAACENLAASLDLDATSIASATAVTEGRFTPPNGQRERTNLPDFCRIELTIAPTSDSDIKTELWLPLNNWNGKFLAVGNGAWAGSIQYYALADGLQRAVVAQAKSLGIFERIGKAIAPERQPFLIVADDQFAGVKNKLLKNGGVINDIGIRHDAVIALQPLAGAGEGADHIGAGPVGVFKPNAIGGVKRLGKIPAHDGDVANAGGAQCSQLPLEQRAPGKWCEAFRVIFGEPSHTGAASGC